MCKLALLSIKNIPSNMILSLAINAARSAGKLMLGCSRDIAKLKVKEKSLHDYVSEVDRECESIITKLILDNYPDHNVVGEEFGSTGNEYAEYQWIVDPLDGTTNYLREIPHYAVSIAVLRNGVIEHGVVFDPSKDELFSASVGKGCFLNDQAIKVSEASSIRGALLSTGIPFSGVNLEQVSSFTNAMESLLEKQTSGIRRLGAASLDLAYVAAGRYDGFWEAHLQPWDIAAGVLLVQEAGGFVIDFSGYDNYLKSGDIIAACPNVVDSLLDSVSEHYQR